MHRMLFLASEEIYMIKVAVTTRVDIVFHLLISP